VANIYSRTCNKEQWPIYGLSFLATHLCNIYYNNYYYNNNYYYYYYYYYLFIFDTFYFTLYLLYLQHYESQPGYGLGSFIFLRSPQGGILISNLQIIKNMEVATPRSK
jgi:hypothetical protein